MMNKPFYSILFYSIPTYLPTYLPASPITEIVKIYIGFIYYKRKIYIFEGQKKIDGIF